MPNDNTVYGLDGTKISEQQWADRDKKDAIYNGTAMVFTSPPSDKSYARVKSGEIVWRAVMSTTEPGRPVGTLRPHA
jgi:hypothetical protein